MIEKSSPQYKLTYKNCNNDKNHIDEALNFVCLNEGCQQHSLICSMCRNEKHQGHSTQPLKFYIEQLKKDYHSGARNYQKEIQSLEQQRATFLYRLKITVQRVAEEFRRLEQDVIQHFELLKSQLIQEQTKKTKFMDFYQSLISEQGQKPQFLIQNYLPKKQTGQLRNIDQIEKLSGKFVKIIQETHTDLFDQAFKQIKIQSVSNLFDLSDTVFMDKNLFKQNNLNMSGKCLNVLKVNLLTDYGKGKIRIRIAKLKKGGQVYVGAIEQGLFETLRKGANLNLFNNTNNGKMFFINNTANVFGNTKNSIKAFSEGSNLEMTMEDKIMKISMKKSSGQFTLPNNGLIFYFFFALIGQTEIEINYTP